MLYMKGNNCDINVTFYSFGIAKFARFVEWGYKFDEPLFPKRVQ